MKIKLIITLLCFSVYSFAQNIHGKFVQQDSIDEGISLTFDQNTFTFQKAGDITNSIGTGKYSIRDNKLKLEFKNVPNQDSSYYSIISGHAKSESASIDLKIQDEKGIGMIGMIVFRAKDYSVIQQFQTDKSGALNIGLKGNQKTSIITIDDIGYYRITIPFSKLKNKQSLITVKLKPASIFYIEPKVVVYKIKKSTNDEIILYSPDEKELKFKRLKE